MHSGRWLVTASFALAVAACGSPDPNPGLSVGDTGASLGDTGASLGDTVETGAPDSMSSGDTLGSPDGATPDGTAVDGTSLDGTSLDGGCIPSCQGKSCGSDGCGGQCGTCIGCDGPSDGLCEQGQCLELCCPNCQPGFECGPDGCGGACGQCAGDTFCNVALHQCVDDPPPPVGSCPELFDCAVSCPGDPIDCGWACAGDQEPGFGMKAFLGVAECLKEVCGPQWTEDCVVAASKLECAQPWAVCFGDVPPPTCAGIPPQGMCQGDIFVQCAPDTGVQQTPCQLYGQQCALDPNTGQPGCVAVGPSPQTCETIVDCTLDCSQDAFTCANQCAADAPPPEQDTFWQVAQCVVALCGTQLDNGCALDALSGACAEPWAVCQDAPPPLATCADLWECALGCPGDLIPCGEQCAGDMGGGPGFEQFVALADCAQGACGPFGGKACWAKAAQAECQALYGACLGGCASSCDGKQCGSDGCGGVCGECLDTAFCNAYGQCVALSPCSAVPPGGLCQGDTRVVCLASGEIVEKNCAAAGMGCAMVLGVAQCVPKAPGLSCGDIFECALGCDIDLLACGEECAGPDADPQSLDAFFGVAECVQAQCGPFTVPQCVKQALDGPCQSSYAACVGGCAPTCAGKECGPDGCGGSCGLCSAGTACTSQGQCQAPNSCANIPPGGVCDGNTVLSCAGAGELSKTACGMFGLTCQMTDAGAQCLPNGPEWSCPDLMDCALGCEGDLLTCGTDCYIQGGGGQAPSPGLDAFMQVAECVQGFCDSADPGCVDFALQVFCADAWAQCTGGPTPCESGCQGDIAVTCSAVGEVFEVNCAAQGQACALGSTGQPTCVAPITPATCKEVLDCALNCSGDVFGCGFNCAQATPGPADKALDQYLQLAECLVQTCGPEMDFDCFLEVSQGPCAAPFVACATGAPPTCVPSCSGKQCGSDGCGGSCGGCPSGASCDDTGQCAAPGQGACNNGGDLLAHLTSPVLETAGACAMGCLGQDPKSCFVACFGQKTGLTDGCTGCYADLTLCGVQACLGPCAQGATAPACLVCLQESGCQADFESCAGLSLGFPATGGPVPPP